MTTTDPGDGPAFAGPVPEPGRPALGGVAQDQDKRADRPDMPGGPGVPDMPGGPDTPDMPGGPDTPDMPGGPGVAGRRGSRAPEPVSTEAQDALAAARRRSLAALADAEALCQTSRTAMRRALDRLETGAGSATDVVAEAALLRRALLSLFDERKRLAQLGSTDGAGGDGADVPVPTLDLAAARAEIRRRLDRLRAAAGGGVVS